MSEPRMVALVDEGDLVKGGSPARKRIISRAQDDLQQQIDSPGRRTRISRAHLTGSLHCHHASENPVLLVLFGQIEFW